MWMAGILQGLMWRAYNEFGVLEYSFIETVAELHIYYAIRAFGGFLFVIGSFIMAYNFYMTIKGELRDEVNELDMDEKAKLEEKTA